MAEHVAWLELIEWQEVSTAARAFEGSDSVATIGLYMLRDFAISL